MKIKCYFFGFIMAFLAMMLSVPTMAATKGRFGSSYYCTVRISNSLLNKKGIQYAYVTLKTQGQFGWNTNGKVRIIMYDEYGRYIWSGVKTASTKLKLGDDHRVYRIYVTCYQEPIRGGWILQSLIRGDNFTNSGKCITWSFSNASGCSIS